MGGLCCGGTNFKDEKNKKFEKGSDRDISEGPLKNRHCTDIICLILFIGHWFLFVMVISLGLADGNPVKLFMPRDYQGAYCGVKEQWNNGPDLESFEVQTYTMNVSATIDEIAKQAICSSAVDTHLLTSMGSGTTDYVAYQEACCKVPAGKCSGAIPEFQGGTASLTSLITSKMSEFTSTSATGLFGTDSANGDMFASIWEDATKYFVKTCSTSCNFENAFPTRTFVYEPAPDSEIYTAWTHIKGQTATSDVKTMLENGFSFAALPLSVCPYSERYCVLFPGVEFTSLTDYYCTFSMSAQVVSAVGGIAANAMEGNAVSGFASSATESFGSWVGEIREAMGGIIVTAFCSFIVGLTFLVLLRFFIGVMVYTAICGAFVFLVLAGGLCYVRSGQCVGDSLLESSSNTIEAATTAGSAAASAAASEGTEFSLSDALAGEAISGNGMSYRGAQTKTVSGMNCVDWATQTYNLAYQDTTNTDWGLESNYCRNPVSDFYTIWCYTADSEEKWETCLPIGVLQPECQNGYEVEGETAREVLLYFGYILWVLALLYILAIWCIHGRIKLAIAVNKVAAMFIYETPQIIVVPIFQVVVGIIWCILWALAATFLVSQVPDDLTPSTAYATYAEAYGSYDSNGDWTVGPCIGDWPTGSVWKDESDCGSDPSSPKCWKCYPPRFVFDYRFAYIFFSFLWNNAMMIAVGQTVIAGAVGIWFFTKHGEKRSALKVGRSVWNVFRYHSGSLAFGSLLVAIVQFLRYLMMYFEKQAQVQKNKVMEIIMKVGQCILWCLEKCIKFLNKNAFIQVALCGTNFCASAKAAMGLIIRNFIRFGVVASLSYITQMVGVFFITMMVSVLGYFILKGMYPNSNPIVPVILFVFMGWLVARLYMAVFQLAVDTSLQSYMIVEEMGGEPGEEDAKFVPGPLVRLLPKNKPSDKSDKGECEDAPGGEI